MSGYVDLERTGHKEVDEILEMIEQAGHSFHNTSQWVDEYDGDKSYLDLIDEKIRAAKKALFSAGAQLEENQITDDERAVSGLILQDDNGDIGVVSSGLTQDFKTGMNVFNVRYPNGSEFRVSVKMEEILLQVHRT